MFVHHMCISHEMSVCGTSLWNFPRYDKRIALIICNTYNLPSVMHDARIFKSTLPLVGYRPENIHVIVTGPITTAWQIEGVPRKSLDAVPGAIVVNSSTELDAAIARVIGQVTAGTSLLISISSHGEHSADGREKILTPSGSVIPDGSEYIRFVWGGRPVIYTDDRLRSMLIDPVPQGAEVMCLVDTCHSGTMLDLPSSVSVDLSSRKASVSRNLDARPVRCDCICVSPTIDTALTYEHPSYRGGMMSIIFCDYIKTHTCIDVNEFIIETQKTLSIVGQSGVLSCSRQLQNGVYPID